jgi:histone H3/H4
MSSDNSSDESSKMDKADSEEVAQQLKGFLENVVQDSTNSATSAGRKQVTAMDIVFALKRAGPQLYGISSPTADAKDKTEK